MRPLRLDRHDGFTLVEMLIAIAIFGVMATVTYRVLNTMLVTRDHVAEQYGRWREIARAMAWMERDLDAILARPGLDALDRPVAPLIGGAGLTTFDEAVIAFARKGELDDLGYPSPPSRVGYRVRNGALERLAWSGLDQAPRSVPAVTVLLSGVAALRLRYRGLAQPWQVAWPSMAGAANASQKPALHTARSDLLDAALPAVVDISIQLASGERIGKLVSFYPGVKR